MTLLIEKYHIQQPGIRYEQNQPPFFMIINLHNDKCWCGKPKKLFNQFMRKYCSNTHADWWYFTFNAVWSNFRLKIIKRDNSTCQVCGINHKGLIKKIKENIKLRELNTFTTQISFEVDHIIAIILGGYCFDLENLRTLCSDCHKIKTKQDMAHLRRKRRGLESLEVFQ